MKSLIEIQGTGICPNKNKMSKNLRNIIREEINDMEWISEVPNIEAGACYKYPYYGGSNYTIESEPNYDEPLIVSRLFTPYQHLEMVYPPRLYNSINDIEPSVYENVTVVLKRETNKHPTKTGGEVDYHRLFRIELKKMIKELEDGTLVPC